MGRARISWAFASPFGGRVFRFLPSGGAAAAGVASPAFAPPPLSSYGWREGGALCSGKEAGLVSVALAGGLSKDEAAAV
uniref:Uncharacterized protein n=1 Tax=Oryza glumipatula TaxID=40148 RepID=A0A0E0BN99_9ORYZ